MARHLASVALALALAGSSQQPGNLARGLRYPPLPRGWTDQSYNLIEDSVGGTDFAVDVMRYRGHDYLWLSKKLGVDSRGRNRWELRDFMPAPRYPRDQTLVIGECGDPSGTDPEILAVVKYDPDEEWMKPVYAAWRADRRNERFVPIDTKGFSCRNVSVGD